MSAWTSPSDPPRKRRVLRVAEDRPAADLAGTGDDAVAGRRPLAEPDRGDAAAQRPEAAGIAEQLELLRSAVVTLGEGRGAEQSHGRRDGRGGQSGGEAEDGVVTAEAEGVGDPRPAGPRRCSIGLRLLGHVVEVEPLFGAAPSRRSAARPGGAATSTVAIASTAPAAPSRWPIADLVELTGMLGRALAQGQLQRHRLAAVVERGRGAVGVDVVDVDRPLRPASASAKPIARAASVPSGCGAVRW